VFCKISRNAKISDKRMKLVCEESKHYFLLKTSLAKNYNAHKRAVKTSLKY